jgi:site-specific DNA-methyltransferase (adenine-specific)
MMSKLAVNEIRQGDSIKLMQAMPAGCVDLAFADPPFNIGYEYDVYQDKKKHDDYLDWSKQWIGAVHRVLKPDGTFWLAIGDEYAAELKLASQGIGFTCRSWVIWYYTFGVNCTNKFSRSHAHLFYFVKDPKTFTFRSEELENRIPSARQLVYADKRANPRGRLPDDTWVLRPQDLADCFTTAEDTWYFPRVAGTFKERAGFHGCQMPEQLLGRIVRLCSQQDDLVFDPFSGSATTVAVAKKLGRRYLGFDLSKDYVKRGRDRLERIAVGDRLDGAAAPTVSAPATPQVSGGKTRALPQTLPKPARVELATTEQLAAFHQGLISAYARSYGKFSLDRVLADPALNARFAAACQQLGLPGDHRTWNWTLIGMRKAGLLAHLPTSRRTEFSCEDCDAYLFASEIAWRKMIDRGCESLDTILCDPQLAEEFDSVARQWAPGYEALEYRWAALKLRKGAKGARIRAAQLADATLGKAVALNESALGKFPESSGVYVVVGSDKTALYAGEASNLRKRLGRQCTAATRKLWGQGVDALRVRFKTTPGPYATRLAYQRRLVVQHHPALNLPEQQIA